MMLMKLKHERDEKLDSYIKKLAESLLDKTEIKKYALLLIDLYKNEYRHSYSRFFPIITEIGKDSKYQTEFLTNNLASLMDLLDNDNLKEEKEKEFKELYKPFSKLSDHINLEIARYNYYIERDNRTQELELKFNEINSDLTRAKDELEKANKLSNDISKKANKATNKIKSMQAELITVLSIFSAIVMTFSGALNFTGNALSQSSALPFPNQLLIMLLCGFILINFVFAMMYFVAKITDRNIYANCNTPDCSCKEKCKSLDRLRKRLPYIFWINIIIFTLILLDIIWIVSS